MNKDISLKNFVLMLVILAIVLQIDWLGLTVYRDNTRGTYKGRWLKKMQEIITIYLNRMMKFLIEIC
jgi:hypothetical protein